MIEGLIVRDLRKHVNSEFFEQYGFKSKCSIDECKYDVCREISNQKKMENEVLCLTVDLKSAYNKVDRVNLLKKIEELKILTEWKLQLLKFLFTDTTAMLG